MAEQQTQRELKMVDIVDFSMQDKATKVTDAFNTLIADKVTSAIDARKQDVSARMFADKVEEPSVEEPAAAEETTAGGIIIPDSAKEKPKKGKIIAAGNGKKDEPLTVKAGDTVLYGQYSGTEIKIDGSDYLIMRESDIFAIVE